MTRAPARRTALVVSCEHGGARVPSRWRRRFAGAERLLASHRGHDRGALALARGLARGLGAPLIACTTTRLLADPNRSLGHPRLFSRRTRALPAAEREALLAAVWHPHRAAVEEEVARALGPRRDRPVLHLSVHSFTPRLAGETRAIDVALLYDPGRPRERAFADRFLAALRARRDDLRLRRNAPYRGTSDGLTTHLRRRFASAPYLGIELEVSQRFPDGPPARWRALRRAILASLAEALAPQRGSPTAPRRRSSRQRSGTSR